jgi:hypothetical protein
LLLVLASTVIVGSKSCGTQDHTLLSHVSDSRAARAGSGRVNCCWPCQHSHSWFRIPQTHDHILLSHDSGSHATHSASSWSVG